MIFDDLFNKKQDQISIDAEGSVFRLHCTGTVGNALVAKKLNL